MRLIGLIVFVIFLALAFLCLIGSIVALLMLRPLLALALFLSCLGLTGIAIIFGVLWLLYKLITL